MKIIDRLIAKIKKFHHNFDTYIYNKKNIRISKKKMTTL